MLPDPVPAHAGGDGCFVDGEGAAEPAALVRPGRLAQFQALDPYEQRPHLVLRGDESLAAGAQAQLAQAVAAAVEADLLREASPCRGLEDIVEEFAKLVDPSAHRIGAVADQRLVVIAHHGDAASRGGDDVLVLFEDAEELLGERPCLLLKA